MNKNLLRAGSRLAATGVLLLLAVCANAADWLFQNGKSDYQIVISSEASASEQTAARELQQYLERISGVCLPITTDLNTSSPRIIVGYNVRVALLTGEQQPATDDEGFTYRTVGHDLLIWGGSHSSKGSLASIGSRPSVLCCRHEGIGNCLGSTEPSVRTSSIGTATTSWRRGLPSGAHTLART